MTDRKPFEQWFESKNAHLEPAVRDRQSWILAAVSAHTRWGQGKEVTEGEFDAAVSEVLGIRLGGPASNPDAAAPEEKKAGTQTANWPLPGNEDAPY